MNFIDPTNANNCYMLAGLTAVWLASLLQYITINNYSITFVT